MQSFQIRKNPERIVCLTEEPTETLYLLGEEKRIVGISAFTCRPKGAQEDHPVVSGFTGGNLNKIVELKPDLVIGFSDIQAQLAKDLIQRNIQVLIFNQRSLQEIFDVILILGRIVEKEKEAKTLVHSYIADLEKAGQKNEKTSFEKRPKVYFEEWDEPMISGIRWVSELIEIVGGRDIFQDRAGGKLAKDRFVSPEEVIERAPDIFIGSWCGKPVDLDSVRKRKGWDHIPAVKRNCLHEMDPAIILQPGPACVTEGFKVLQNLIQSH